MNERSSKRIRSGAAKVRLASTIPGAPAQEALEIVDISMRGMGVKLPFPLASDQELGIELYHPILEGVIKLNGRTAWCRMVPGDPYPNAGVEFVDTDEAQRMILRLIQAAEVSCRVISANCTAGFVVTPTENNWALYDANTVKVATLTRIGPQFQVTFLGTRPEDSVHVFDADTLPEAVALALNLQGSPLIVPPEGGHWIPVPYPPVRKAEAPRPTRTAPHRLERPITTERPVLQLDEESEADRTQLPGSARFEHQPRAFHSILAGGYHVGFVAVTSVDDVWSLYDEHWNEIAMMSPFEGRYKVNYVAGDGSRGASDSLDYIIARTFLGGISVAFDLKVEAELDPPLLTPEDTTTDATPEPEPEPEIEDDEAPLPTNRDHHCIIDKDRGLVGYISPTLGMEGQGVWSIYNAQREKVAMVAPDENRFKVMFIGGDPDDSIDYMVARNLKGAIALTFELDSIPKFDPPIPR